MSYAELLERIAAAMRAPDPVAALAEAARSAESEDQRTALLCASADGLRISALLVARLRFEALIQTSARAAALFADSPERFAELFRCYHQSVPAADPLGWNDSRAFDAWLAARP